MAKNYIQNGTTAEFVATADVVSGQVVVLGGLLGVAADDVLETETGVAMIEGVFELPKVAGVAMDQGDFVTFDASTGQVIAEGGAGVAYVMADAVEADEVVLVKINAGAGAGGAGGLTPVPVAGVEVTVGAIGDFATLSEAIQSVSETYAPAANSGKMTIRILTGTTLAEQVECYSGADLSWITVIADDASVPVDLSAITSEHPNTEMGNYKPFIGVAFGTKSPNFKVSFATSAASTDGAIAAMMVTGLGSELNSWATGDESWAVGFTRQGLNGWPGFAIYALYGSKVNADYIEINACEGGYGDVINTFAGVDASFREANVNGNNGAPIGITDNCTIDASGADFSANARGAYIKRGSTLYAKGAKFRVDSVDAVTDLSVGEASIVYHGGGGANGGTDIATPNAISADGIYFDLI